MKLYKVTGPNGKAIHGGSGAWPLPKGKKPGAWTKTQKPNLCVSGWHVIPAHAFGSWWQNGAILWEAEGRGKCSESDDKSAYASARLLRRIGVLTPKARKAYDEAYATARKAYDEAYAPASKAYDEAYATARKAFDEAYDEACATARKAYNEACATARKAYNEACAPARKAYNEAFERTIEEIFKGAS